MDDEFGEIPDFSSLVSGNSRTLKTTEEPGPSREQPPTQPTPSKVQQPKPQALPPRTGPSSILVSPRQKGNPVLSHIRLLPWEHADIPADYVLGKTTCALFLSLKYHRLHPEYIYTRIRALAGKYDLRVLLIMVDIPNHEDSLKELSKTSLVNNLTLVLCWSAPEVAHYLELFKSSENAQPTAIQSQQAQSYSDSLVEFVTSPRSINKSDAASLISTFGSLQAAVNARPEQISQVPGWGERKVQQWTNAVKEDFRVAGAAKRGLGQLAVRAEDRNPAGAVAAPSSTRTAAAENLDVDNTVPVDSIESAQGSNYSPLHRETEDDVDPGIGAALAKLREKE